MDNAKSKVIIIDHNVSNGVYLSACCNAVMPKTRIRWVRISDDKESLDRLLQGAQYEVVESVERATAVIDRQTRKTNDLIIFFNVRIGLYQADGQSKIESPILRVLKKLVNSEHRLLVNIHSTEIPTREIAEAIDPLFKTKPREAKVICHHLITGALPTTILEMVRETLVEWNKRYLKNGRQAKAKGAE